MPPKFKRQLSRQPYSHQTPSSLQFQRKNHTHKTHRKPFHQIPIKQPCPFRQEMHPKTNRAKWKQPTRSPWTLNYHLQTRRRFLDGQSQRTADWVLVSSQPDRQLVSCKQSKNRQGTSYQSAVHSPDVRVPDNKKLTKKNWKIYRHWAVQQKLLKRHTEWISKPQWGHSKKLSEENHSLRMESPQEQNRPQQVGAGCFCDDLKWINSAQHAQILD